MNIVVILRRDSLIIEKRACSSNYVLVKSAIVYEREHPPRLCQGIVLGGKHLAQGRIDVSQTRYAICKAGVGIEVCHQFLTQVSDLGKG